MDTGWDLTEGVAAIWAASVASFANLRAKIALPCELVLALRMLAVPDSSMTVMPGLIGVTCAVMLMVAPAMAVGFALRVTFALVAWLAVGLLHMAAMTLIVRILRRRAVLRGFRLRGSV